MPSTYSTSLKLQLIGTGEQAGVWGTTTNYNLGTLLEQAITGVVTLNMGDATYTMTNYNGLSDEARNAVLVLNGPITSPQLLVAPSGQQKTYIVRNRTGNTVTLTTGSGSNVNIANAASEVVFTDGTNFYSATQFNYIDGNLTVSGSEFIGGNLAVSGQTVLLGDAFGNVNTGQWYIPTGNTAARSANGTHGLFRYNSELQIYEGYANNNWIRFLVANQGSYTISYVAVGGGGGGGPSSLRQNSGGGAGKVVSSTTPAVPGTTVLTITVGAGGAGAVAGSSTLITGVVDSVGGQPGAASGGTSGNGYAGGEGAGPFEWGGGGGGGAGAAGANGAATVGGNLGGAGGTGVETLITGTSQYFGGGGGGYGTAGSGSGGTGGGGAGGLPANNGTVNTGGGGGGPANGNLGGSGGSGVVFLSMPTVNYTGVFTGSPTVTTTGSNTVLKYTGSGTYTA
jgi:hypothetical protein